MKTLLWKDYRQNFRVLVAIVIFLLVPYFIVASIGVAGPVKGQVAEASWAELFHGGSIGSLLMSVALAAFIGGNVIAGERADRSAEFIAYLPISRRQDVASKAILAIGACLLIWLVNVSVLYLTGLAAGVGNQDTGEIVSVTGVTAVLIFGVSWLFSSLLSSPGIAAAAGLAAMMLVGGTLAFVGYVTGIEGDWPVRWYFGLCACLGVGCFVGGVVHCLRRVEP